jgi:hypothetical protein
MPEIAALVLDEVDVVVKKGRRARMAAWMNQLAGHVSGESTAVRHAYPNKPKTTIPEKLVIELSMAGLQNSRNPGLAGFGPDQNDAKRDQGIGEKEEDEFFHRQYAPQVDI